MEKRMYTKYRILFQGDSVTDAGRDRSNGADLGRGYPYIISALLGATRPEMKFDFLNRGIGGDKVIDLKRRWQQDCVNIRPDLVSILIGVNDSWRDKVTLPTTVEAFEESYRELLNVVKDETEADLIIMEPFLLPVESYQEDWLIDDCEKIGRRIRC